VLVLVLLFVAAVLATLQLLRRRPFALRAIPLILAVPLLLGAVGPWSVLRIAKRDQQDRLAEGLREARVDTRVAARDTSTRVIPGALYARINGAAMYLQTHFGEDALAEVIGREAAQRAWGWAEHFHLMASRNDTMPATLHGSLPPNANIPLTALNGRLLRIQTDGSRLRISPQRQLSIAVGADTFLVQIDSIIARMPPTHRREQSWLPPTALQATDRSGQIRGELIIFEAVVQQSRDSVRVIRLDGVLLIR
jgi:hypothetical protein